MAMINCPECDSEVSDKAQSCPKCGYGLSSIGLSKTITENKKNPCMSDIENQIAIVNSYKKKIKISWFFTFVCVLSIVGVFAALIPIGFGLYFESKKKKAMLEITPCLKSIYMSVALSEVNTNFNSIEDNKDFSSFDSVEFIYQIYIYAHKLDADAIVFGDVSSSTHVSAHTKTNGKVSVSSATKLSNVVSFLKLK
jgi:hypothetical protein